MKFNKLFVGSISLYILVMDWNFNKLFSRFDTLSLDNVLHYSSATDKTY